MGTGLGTDATAAGTSRARRRPRRLGRRLLSLGFALVLGAVVAEAVVLLVMGEQAKCPRHVVEAPWALRYNSPGARYGHSSPDGDWEFRINAQGMRADRDYGYAKPPGVQRILSLGDSYTIGYEVEVEECFSSVLERRLRDEGLEVEVLNCGMSGASNAEALAYVERELLAYAPDLVVVSFFANDLADNVRSRLYELRGDELVALEHRYVPAGTLGNLLNDSAVFNWLGEHSNAFAFLLQRVTMLLKGESSEEHISRARQMLDPAAAQPAAEGSSITEDQRLCAAIFERLYRLLNERGIPLVVQSIPMQVSGPRGPLLDAFPAALFDPDRPGLALLEAKALLEPEVPEHLLYHQRTFFHWTPRAHELSGNALAALILERRLLGPAP